MESSVKAPSGKPDHPLHNHWWRGLLESPPHGGKTPSPSGCCPEWGLTMMPQMRVESSLGEVGALHITSSCWSHTHTHTPLLWVYFGHCNINKLTNWEGKPETDFSGALFHWSPPNPFHDVLGISSKLMKKQHEGPAGFQTRLPLLLKELQPLQIRREASLERLRSCRAAQRFSLIKPNSGSITAPLLYPFHTL